MQVRRAYRPYRQPLPISLCLASIVIGSLAVSACSHSPSRSASKPVNCGGGQTAAHVPVTLSVNSAAVSCSSARTIEQDYAAAIREGKAPGAGGSGPVKVSGWTCSAFPTPEMLKTGNASKCVKGTTEILATLTT
jgi:hypothetical protein